jgi:hypothetical protein
MDKQTKNLFVNMLLALQVLASRLRGEDRANLEGLIVEMYESLRCGPLAAISTCHKCSKPFLGWDLTSPADPVCMDCDGKCYDGEDDG